MIILAWKQNTPSEQKLKLVYKNSDIAFEIDATKRHECLHEFHITLTTLTFLKILRFSC